jgi:RNA polymerase sigma-70 factor, ECF subfamily
MSSPQCRADATPAGAPIENHSAGAELSTFERDVVSMHAQLYRHAYHLSQNREDAEDLVQETMMKAYRAFHTFQGGTNLNAWVFRILTNTFINAYRKKKRQPVQCSTEEVTDQGLAKAYAHSTPMGMRSSEDQALDLLPDNDIKAAMQAMPQQFRDVVYYADVEGLRYTEIAAIMNTPKGTVVSRLGARPTTTARLALRRRWWCGPGSSSRHRVRPCLTFNKMEFVPRRRGRTAAT